MEIHDPVATILAKKPNRDIWSVAPDTTVYDAVKLMSDRDVGAVLVLDGGKLVGIVSERDYTRKVVLQARSSRDTAVREIMIHPVICVDPQTKVDPCLHLMTEKRVRHLPVVEDAKVVGIVSIGDLVSHVISTQEAMINQLEHFISGSYPG